MYQILIFLQIFLTLYVVSSNNMQNHVALWVQLNYHFKSFSRTIYIVSGIFTTQERQGQTQLSDKYLYALNNILLSVSNDI